MKPKLILLQLALALCCVSSNAGNAFDFYFDDCESKFSNMSAYCHEALDLKILLPADFIDMSKMGAYVPKSKHRGIGIGCTFDAMAKSSDGECLMLVPEKKGKRFYDKNDYSNCYNSLLSEVYWSIKGTFSSSYFWANPPLVDIRKYVKEINAAPMNADKAYLVTLPANNDTLTGKQYVGKVILFLEKKGRLPISTTLLFTANGLKSKQQYVASVLKSIGFGNQNDWKYDECLDAKLAEKYFAPYYEFCKRQRAIQREKEKAINAAKKQAEANNNVSSDK